MKESIWKTDLGIGIIKLISAVVIWGIAFLCYNICIELFYFITIICSIFGWIKLNRIQPVMFLWMSWVGWIVYFIVKYIIAAAIGLFITPIYIAEKISIFIANHID